MQAEEAPVCRLMEAGGAETPEATRVSVRAQYELWGKVVREIGLQPE